MKKEAGFKDGVHFDGQSREKVVKYCKLVRTCCYILPGVILTITQTRHHIPYLCHFKHDWATTTYLHRSMHGGHKYLKKHPVTNELEDGEDTGHMGDEGSDDAYDNIVSEEDEYEFMDQSGDESGEDM